MQAFIPLILMAWIPVVVFLCWLLPPRAAVLTAFLFAIMFLPVTNASDPDSHHMSKITATGLGVILGGWMFHSGILLRFRPRWFDLPVVLWCMCPFISSVTNGLGEYDGFWESYAQAMAWTVPYFVGRIYFSGLLGLRQLLTAIFIGGLVYAPFVITEMRISPQLHRYVYGYHQHDFGQTYRWGGWRPMVFMDHGLMVAMWMAMACLAGFWLWWTGTKHKLFGIRIEALVLFQLLVTAGCKSLGALLLLAIGTTLLWISWTFKLRFIVAMLAVVSPIYLTLRIHGDWHDLPLVKTIENHFGSDRAESLQFRIRNEELILTKALEQPWFGWGGYDRGAVYDDIGKKISISDSLWIVTLSMYGLCGVVGVFASQLIPPLVYLYRRSTVPWRSKLRAPALGLTMIVLLYSLDNLFNAMPNPMFVIIAGGLAGCRPLRVIRMKVKPYLSRADESEPQDAVAEAPVPSLAVLV